MRDRPSGPELLEIARETLLRELLAFLPEERRVEALMVASAMAIAAREAASGEAPLHGLEARLAEVPADSWRALCAQIREGRLDGSNQVRELLWDLALLKLRESNPKLLSLQGLA